MTGAMRRPAPGWSSASGLATARGALTAEGRFRALVAHEADGYEEWGASASVRYGAGESGRGLTLELAPEWGNTGSAAEQLWSARAAGDLVTGDAFEAPGRLRADLGYGFGLGGGTVGRTRRPRFSADAIHGARARRRREPAVAFRPALAARRARNGGARGDARCGRGRRALRRADVAYRAPVLKIRNGRNGRNGERRAQGADPAVAREFSSIRPPSRAHCSGRRPCMVPAPRESGGVSEPAADWPTSEY